VGVQPEVVVAAAPGRRDRVRLIDHDGVEAGPADRPGRRQASRARADDHDMLIHGASYRPRHGDCYQDGLVRRRAADKALVEAAAVRGLLPGLPAHYRVARKTGTFGL